MVNLQKKSLSQVINSFCGDFTEKEWNDRFIKLFTDAITHEYADKPTVEDFTFVFGRTRDLVNSIFGEQEQTNQEQRVITWYDERINKLERSGADEDTPIGIEAACNVMDDAVEYLLLLDDNYDPKIRHICNDLIQIKKIFAS